jgi:CHAT domain-containing protein/Tfp pilus assembly protein PilF
MIIFETMMVKFKLLPGQKRNLLLTDFNLTIFLSVFIFLAAQPIFAQSDTKDSLEITPLELNKTLDRKISGGEKHIYQIAFAAKQYAKIIVRQRGVDVIAKMSGADGKPLLEYDSEIRSEGEEIIEMEAEAAGNYRLEIASKYKMLPAGSYEISFKEQRPANEKDQSLQAARLFYDEALNLRRAGKAAAAIPLAAQALEIQEKNLDAENLDVARTLNLLGNLSSDTSDYEKAESIYQRALAIRTKVFGETNPTVASTLSDLGVIYRLQGEPERAEPLYRRALAIREKSLGREHPEVARTLNNLGNLLLDGGDYSGAEKIYLQALAIREKTTDPNDPAMAATFNVLAVTYDGLGDLVKAETMYLRALSISEKNLPPEHPTIANYLDNLAGIYSDLGDFAKAEPLYQRALAIREKTLGPDDLMVSVSLNNIGNFYKNKKNYAEAEKAYLRSLEIREKIYKGKPHPWIVQSLFNLGDLMRVTGNLTKAESYAQRALAVAEKLSGADNPSLAYSLTALANVYQESGKFQEAESLYRRVLAIYDQTLGTENAMKAKILTALATLYLTKGDLPSAVSTQTQANTITEKHLALNLALGSEQKKLIYLASLSRTLDRTLTINFYAKDKREASEMALTNILQRKGRVLDAMSDTLSVLRQRFNPEDRDLLDKLNESNAKLALLVLNGPKGETLAEHQKEVAALEEKRDVLEVEVSRRAAGFYEPSKPITLESVRANIPGNAALVEFAVYRLISPEQEESKESEETHYAAYVVGRQGEIQMKDLGKASEIDAAVEAFRLTLHDPKSRNAAQSARSLDDKIMKPLRGLIGDKKQILLSPDGALNLIPFEALIDEQNKYLVENYSFTYLTSGRDLLRMQTARASKSNLLVIANPTFGAPLIEATAKTETRTKKPNRRDRQRSVTNARDLSETYFAQLNGTVREARSIKGLFPDATFLIGANATETALKQTAAPRILHIATHGFFLEDTGENNSQSAVRGLNAGGKIENPLVRSGLALAGANRRDGVGDDGILTALEASGLNLWGTKLVVLSACDTGIGEVKNGEGVYGLRRSFVLAGAESMVMSLWSVSDSVTRELMTDYYKNLKSGMGRGASLRQVQLAMLKRKDREHPFYWAAFIQSGEWANLDGKR